MSEAPSIERRLAELKESTIGIARSMRDLSRAVRPSQRPTGGTNFARHAALRFHVAMSLGGRGSTEDLWQERYGGSRQRAAVSPASTSVPAWASELTATDTADFIAAGAAPLALARLAALGLSVDLSGALRIPYRAPGALAGGWVGEAAAIPVERLNLSAVTLVPRKLASISTFSGELKKHSNPSIEAILDAALRSDLARIVDGSLVDTNPATTLRPAGLRNGVSGLTPSASADPIVAMRADLAALAAAVIAGGGTAPAFIVNPVQAIGIAFATNPLPYVVIDTVELAAGTVIAVDGASFASAVGPAAVDASRDAAVHEEDTTPLAISTAGSPNVVSAPVRSTWQTDTVGIRCLLDATWAVPPGRAAWVAGVSW